MKASSPLDTVKSWVPDTMKWWLKTRVQGKKIPRVDTIESVFPGLRRERILPPLTVDAPLLDVAPLWDNVSVLRGATYTSPEGVVDEVEGGYFCTTNRVLLGPDRSVVAESLCTRMGPDPTMKMHYPFQKDAVFGDDILDIDGLCTSFQFHRRNYYHTLVDALPRLYLLDRVATTTTEPIKILCSELSNTERHYLDLLRPEGTVVVEVPSGVIVRTERFLHLSFLSRQGAGFLPPTYLQTFRNAVLPDRPPLQNRRLFVTREIVGTRQIRNRDALLKTLSRHGFERIELETLSPDEQVNAFYDAEIIIATHGASLANLLFTGPQTRLIELFPHSFFIPNYYLLSLALNVEYDCLFANEVSRYANFNVNVDELLSLLAVRG